MKSLPRSRGGAKLICGTDPWRGLHVLMLDNDRDDGLAALAER